MRYYFLYINAVFVAFNKMQIHIKKPHEIKHKYDWQRHQLFFLSFYGFDNIFGIYSPSSFFFTIKNLTYDEVNKKSSVKVEQIQNPQRQPAIFQMPVSIDIYKKNGEVDRQNVWIDQRIQTFEFDLAQSRSRVLWYAKH